MGWGPPGTELTGVLVIGAIRVGTDVLFAAKGSRGLARVPVVPVAKAAGLPIVAGAWKPGKGPDGGGGIAPWVPESGAPGVGAMECPAGVNPAGGAEDGGGAAPKSGSAPAGAPPIGHPVVAPVPLLVFLQPQMPIRPASIMGVHIQRPNRPETGVKAFMIVVPRL